MIALEIEYQFFNMESGIENETECKVFPTMDATLAYIVEIGELVSDQKELYIADSEYNDRVLSVDYRIRAIY